MKKNSQRSFSLFLSLVIALSFLSACSKKTPEDILVKTKQALVDLNSGKVKVTFDINTEDEKTLLAIQGDIEATFDQTMPQSKVDFVLNLQGAVTTDGQKAGLTLSLQGLRNGVDYYFKMNQLNTTAESLQFLQTIFNSYQEKWLRLDESFIPPQITSLGGSTLDELNLKQRQDLFVQTELFTIKEDKGIQTLNGLEVYDLVLNLEKDAFKNYVRQIVALEGQIIPESELEAMTAALNQVKNIEIFVDPETYYIYKANINLYNTTSEEGLDFKIDLTFEGTDFNQAVKVTPPQNAEDFNPLALPAHLEDVPTEVTPPSLLTDPL